MEPMQGELQLVHYESQDVKADFSLDPTNETVWASQQEIADAFGIDRTGVGRHLKEIFADGELDETAVCAKFARTGSDGKTYLVQNYNLEAILSVGYRISSKKATAFRQWATKTLKDYIVQGFALNEQRLRNDPHALRELAARVRALRSDEKNIYQNVRDVFAFGSADYDKDSPAVRSFYAKLQDRFLYAVSGKTASEIKLERANHKLPSMGLKAMKGTLPSRADVDVGKNYLNEEELYSLHIICEQFLLFVESRAIRGQQLTMSELSLKFDELLKVQGHSIFPEYKDFLAARAKAHAMREYDRWFERTKQIPRDSRREA